MKKKHLYKNDFLWKNCGTMVFCLFRRSWLKGCNCRITYTYHWKDFFFFFFNLNWLTHLTWAPHKITHKIRKKNQNEERERERESTNKLFWSSEGMTLATLEIQARVVLLLPLFLKGHHLWFWLSFAYFFSFIKFWFSTFSFSPANVVIITTFTKGPPSWVVRDFLYKLWPLGFD